MTEDHEPLREIDERTVIRWLAENDWSESRACILAQVCLSLFRANREAEEELRAQARAFARAGAASAQKPPEPAVNLTWVKMWEPIHALELPSLKRTLAYQCPDCTGRWNLGEMEAHYPSCASLKAP